MLNRDYRNVAAGLVLTAIGLYVAVHAHILLDVGTARQMGPGMFPIGGGLILALLGLMIALPAISRRTVPPDFDFKSGIIILSSIAAFAVIIDWLGLIAAIFTLVLIASIANRPMKLGPTLVLSALLTAAVILVFREGLGMQLPIYRWPF